MESLLHPNGGCLVRFLKNTAAFRKGGPWYENLNMSLRSHRHTTGRYHCPWPFTKSFWISFKWGVFGGSLGYLPTVCGQNHRMSGWSIWISQGDPAFQRFQVQLPSLKLTVRTWKMTPWKRRFLSETIIFRGELLVLGSVIFRKDTKTSKTSLHGTNQFPVLSRHFWVDDFPAFRRDMDSFPEG